MSLDNVASTASLFDTLRWCSGAQIFGARTGQRLDSPERALAGERDKVGGRDSLQSGDRVIEQACDVRQAVVG